MKMEIWIQMGFIFLCSLPLLGTSAFHVRHNSAAGLRRLGRHSRDSGEIVDLGRHGRDSGELVDLSRHGRDSGELVDLTDHLQYFNDTIVGKPTFAQHGRHVIEAIGNAATLNCPVINFGESNIGKKEVTWARPSNNTGRKGIFQTISYGTTMFLNDRRFKVIKETNNWKLIIDPAKLSDSGVYECQVPTSTSPGKAFRTVSLEVVVPVVTISGPKTRHIDKGSPISLTCTVSNSPRKPEYIWWYHDDLKILPSATFQMKVGEDEMSSTLTISGDGHSLGGNYRCAPNKLGTDTVSVHVTIGEDPQALADIAPATTALSFNLLLLISVILMCTR